MDCFKPPEAFNVDEPQGWPKWKQRFRIFLLASQKQSVDENIKIALLLNVLGETCLDVYNTFPKDKVNEFEDVLSCFDDHFLPKTNTTMETFKFNNIQQKEGQSIDSFITELKKQANNCAFVCENEQCKTSYADRMIRDKLVLGLRDGQVQRHLLREPSMSLERIQEYCRSIEITMKHVELLNKKSEEPQEVLTFRYKNQDKKCSRCSYTHGPRKCPAFNQTCANCQKKGHFAKVCFFKDQGNSSGNSYFTKGQDTSEKEVQLKNVSVQEDYIFVDNSSDSSVFICEQRQQEFFSKNSWYETIEINDVNIYFKLDTGAESSVLPVKYLNLLNIKKSEIIPTSMVIISFGNYKSKPLGHITLKCKFKNLFKSIKFLVVELESEPLLGLNDCLGFNMVCRINCIQNKFLSDNVVLPMDKHVLYSKFKEIFEGLGCMPGLVDIKLKTDAKPVVQIQRKVPLALHERLKSTLNDLEKKNIITKVDYPTEWVNSLMIVEKPNGSLRLCLDPKPLNKYICREYYNIPKCDDILGRLEGKTIFSVIDMKDGFWQIQLTERSSDLCTFNTPFGRYKFNRVPFGLNNIPEIFQKKNIEIFGDIPNVNIYFDDIIISGSNEKEHDIAFRNVLKKALTYNIKFNFEKLQYKLHEVNFLGQVISKNGIVPSQKNIQAVLALEVPTNKKELLRILGLFKFFSKFIPNLSQLTYNLRKLTRNDTEFKWSNEHQEEIDTLKTLITNKPILKMFDENKPIIIQTDASSKGIGSCMMQANHPISFASRSLNKAEEKYAQIEKELLSIVFSCEKFHFWIYGREVIVKTDHKPLIPIFQKNLDCVSNRLQRMLLKLQKYNLKIEYLPGTQMYVADTLSRSFMKIDSPIDLELEYVIHTLSLTLPITKEKKLIFQNAIDNDFVLLKVKNFCLTEWPKNDKKLNSELSYYYGLRQDIFLSDNLLFYKKKIIVPSDLKKDMLKLIHSAHFGIQKSKLRAREIMIWPKMSTDIETFVSNCEICQLNKPANQKETLVSHKTPERPWQILFSDFFEYKSKNYLLIVDSYSHWLEIFPTEDKTARTVIKHCKDIFSKFGCPDLFYSDNVPYNSMEFKDFAKSWNFECEFSSPHHHASNGFAEKYVDISKNMLKKMKNISELPHYLLEYRNTPLSRLGFAPSQLLLNRLVKTKLPISSTNLLPKIIDDKEIIIKLKQNSEKTQEYFNKTAKDLPPLQKDDNVLFQKNNLWNKGKIISMYNDRSYIVKDTEGNEFRRNRKFINKTNLPVNVSDYNNSDLFYEIKSSKFDVDASSCIPPVVNSSTILDYNCHTTSVIDGSDSSLSMLDLNDTASLSGTDLGIESTSILGNVDKTLINSENTLLPVPGNEYQLLSDNEIEYELISASETSEGDYTPCDGDEDLPLLERKRHHRVVKPPKYLEDYDL